MLSRPTLLVCAWCVVASALPQSQSSLPAKGDNGAMGGIFGITESAKSMSKSSPKSSISPPDGRGWTGKDAPVGFMNGYTSDNSGGSGLFSSRMQSDKSLPGHTIYAPKTPVAGLKLPVIVWGNGGCIAYGASFQNFLTEVASHGYLVVANGAESISALFSGQSKVSDLVSQLEWRTIYMFLR
jgi:hypothetical protein